MLPTYANTAAFLLVLTVFSAALTFPETLEGPLIQQLPSLNLSISQTQLTLLLNYSAPAVEPAPVLNITTPIITPEAIASNNININCQYGPGLSYDSCLDAFNTFKESRTGNLTVGPRIQTGTTYWLKYDLLLPVRWISGDGHCTFDIVKSGRGTYTNITALELQVAAVSLLNLCVKDRGGQGGIASGVGPNGDIGVILRSYSPRNLDCGDTGPGAFTDDCDLMGQTMKATTGPPVRFGPKASPDTEVALPCIWAMRPPKRCIRTLVGEETGIWDTSTYFDLWQAFIAIKGMCVRYGKKGRMKGLGAGGKMWLIVNPLQTGPADVGF